ncbi:adenosylcobinamide-GDP ribazoletransferase [Paenibacillus sediminis]|uniref:Adenosylcobinamide-GDP ribazoletransferase n=1 Tax=Paenibacillus sediminis TaxID=664909 RepID=A0ABS4H4K7_9BACL|nr:adenosylcobinamide-GDP ribazoletransferase [Paenibacillus sediminis]MBP1937463.1 adenosylcobinamide-GDP ribazoletransferase [Paenibacillus sediminis]
MTKWIQAATAAFQFLSRFPVKAELEFTPELLKRSVKFYPLVGASIGLVVWLVGFGFSLIMPSLSAAVLTLILWVWLTGGLHLDGLMDTADALLSYRSRDKMLEIMKDSRVGAMGVIACVLLLLMKVSLLDSIIEQKWGSGAFLLPMIWSRSFMGYAMNRWPMARQGEGLAGQFRNLGTKQVLLSIGIAVFLSVLFIWIGIRLGFGSEKWSAEIAILCIMPVICLGVGTLFASRMSARLGGLTGDTYGALNELLEAVLLLFCVITMHIIQIYG